MSKSIIAFRNPLLEPFNIFIGKWSVSMTHVALPNTLVWEDTFVWLENSFILWHWQGRDEVPAAKLIIGSNTNGATAAYKMFYYDSREISRKFEMTFEKGVWKFWREDADFYQRFEGVFNGDNTVITGHGENSHDKGKSWVHDFAIKYDKIE